MREIAEQQGCSNVSCIGVYQLAGVEPSAPFLCQLNIKPTNYPAGACPLCKAGSVAISLHPGLYYLKDFPEKPVVLGASHFRGDSTAGNVGRKSFWGRLLQRVRGPAPQNGPAAFMKRYHALPELLSVHRDDRERRHHAFHVNVGAMLDCPMFEERYVAQLKAMAKPQVIVTPEDDISMRLGAVAAEVLRCPSVALNSLRNLTHLSETARGLLQNSTEFLILDDVLVSGSRLSSHNENLRRRAKRPTSVNFLVGLGRPTSEVEWKKLIVALTKNVPWTAQLQAVEQFYLPNWDTANCPWCREYDFLSAISSPLPDPPVWLTDRVASLSERESASGCEPLLLLPGVLSPRLGHGSLVGPEGMTSTAALFSLASALQWLRNDDERKRLNPHFPEFRVFDVKNVRNYSEGLLRAAILRTVLPREWGHTLQPQSLCQELAVATKDVDQEVVLGEILLGIARGSIDGSMTPQLQAALAARDEELSGILIGGLGWR